MTKLEAEKLAKCVEIATVRALTAKYVRDIIKTGWDESLHPRDNSGRFCAADGTGGGADNGADDTSFSNCTAQEFHDAISSAKNSRDVKDRWRVDVHDADEYNGDTLHVTKGGSTVAVTSDGDIISVCKMRGDTIKGAELMKMAVENGGVKLDSFGGNHNFYTSCGFEPVSWTPFNRDYAPEGWNPEIHKAEPVVFYRYTGNTNQPSLEKFLDNTPPCAGNDGYDTARDIRDAAISKER